MIVQRFQAWAKTANPTRRADGASALARACLYSDLSDEDYADALRTLTTFLDDPSPLVRTALAEAFASAADAPHHIVLALAEDQGAIASIVLARSPVLTEAELIDCAATAGPAAQAAIADRPDISSPLAAALAEVGAAEAAAVLARNPVVRLPEFSIRRLVERHGDNADVREALLGRSDLPPRVRLDLVTATTRALAAFVSDCNWMSNERMARVARESIDRAAIEIADTSFDHNAALDLVAHLREANQLTVGFILRTVLSGKIELFRAALSDLSGLPLARVDGLTDHYDSTGFAALYRKADLPEDMLPVFRIALRTARDMDWTMAHGSAALSRTLIERVLTACEELNNGEFDKLVVLLRRFESEAARDEARQPEMNPPLMLSDPREPLLLGDFESDEDDRDESTEDDTVVMLERPRFTVDLEAIAAELQAA